jgi:hypothetical protein
VLFPDPASRDRRRAAREMQRRMRELDRLDREFGLGAMPTADTRPAPPRKQGRGALLPGLLISALRLASVVALSPDEHMRTLRRLIGFEGRLGDVPFLADGDGSYAFALTQRGSKEPVTYDPCRAIEVAVNPQGAPDNYDDLVDTAIERTSEATGFRFERVGTTDDRDFTRRQGGLGSRPPVLVAWADEDEVPELEGDVAGIGGSTASDFGTGRLRYVSGIVVLDADVFDDFGGSEEPYAQAIVDHEFGHLVGLDHVDDRGELMNAENLGRTTYGPGDLEGLARLGRVDC